MIVEQLMPKLIRAGFESDYSSIESLSMLIIKKIKNEYPDISDEISRILSYRNIGSSTIRSKGIEPSPVDKDTRFPLAKIKEPEEIPSPIFGDYIYEQVNRFIKEREMSNVLIREGINPPNSMLLYGSPGVGKTHLAKWISYKLDLNLIIIDLATSISSYLGKTGQNIKNLLDYARSYNCILFLDEFDAIAKRRDDQTDIGELKRIVNVLLKELEEWPINSIVIAATNHPELLDKAIWRRFDKIIEITKPNNTERKEILLRELEMFEEDLTEIIELLTKYSGNMSAADLCKYCDVVKRRFIIDKENPYLIMISELLKQVNDDLSLDQKTKLCKKIKKLDSKLSIREISAMTGFSSASVQRYLKG